MRGHYTTEQYQITDNLHYPASMWREMWALFISHWPHMVMSLLPVFNKAFIITVLEEVKYFSNLTFTTHL
jgi:hypothetical protein